MNARTLRPGDAAEMARVHARSFDTSWSALDFSVHAARDLCVGTGEPLASFCVLRRSPLDAEILTIATDPDHRGKGLAGDILRAAIAMLSDTDCRDIFLEVAEDNDAARALYARLGFSPIGRRPGYYKREGGRVAAVTYGLSLLPE